MRDGFDRIWPEYRTHYETTGIFDVESSETVTRQNKTSSVLVLDESVFVL